MNLSRLSVQDVESRARNVEREIKKLEHRPRPTPSERSLTTELKKLRLSLKDRLANR